MEQFPQEPNIEENKGDSQVEGVKKLSPEESMTFEASKSFFQELGGLYGVLSWRDRENLNAIIDPSAFDKFRALESGKDRPFEIDKPITKDELFTWLTDLSFIVDAIGRAPKEASLRDDVDNLGSLTRSLVGMQYPVTRFLSLLPAFELNKEEEQKLAELRGKLEHDLQIRIDFLGRRRSSIQDYLDR